MRKRPEFKHCFDSGRRYFSKNFVVFAAPRSGREPWRLGLTVPRRVGSAVWRNRIKRVLRDFFRLHQHEFDLPFDVVVVPKKRLDPRRVGLEMATGELLPVIVRMQQDALRVPPAGE